MLRFLTLGGLAGGVLLMTGLIAWQGAPVVLALVSDVGLSLLLLPLVWLPSHGLATWSWRMLFEPGRAPGFGRLLWAAFIGRAVNNLLPVAQLGGEIVKVRALVLRGHDSVEAAASVMVDKTVQALAMVPFALIGMALLLVLATSDALIGWLLAGLLLLSVGIAGFIGLQRAGLFRLMHALAGQVMRSEDWHALHASAVSVDDRIRAIYRNRGAFLAAVCVRLLSYAAQIAEVWLAARLLGQPIGLPEATMLKSLAVTVADSAFIVPNAYGVQEGAYVMLGALVGLEPSLMLALSLATRVRELLIDLPWLLVWQHLEATHALRRRPGGNRA